MYWSSKPEGADFLSILSTADQFTAVSSKGNPAILQVLMPSDVVLLDSRSTEYEGRICLVKSMKDGKKHFQRVYFDGDAVILTDPTDGETNERFSRDELVIDGIVTGIIRKLEAEPYISKEEQDAARAAVKKAMADPLQGYYNKSFERASAIKAAERGSGYGCFFSGWYLGFVDGRRAERRYRKRQQKAKEGGNA